MNYSFNPNSKNGQDEELSIQSSQFVSPNNQNIFTAEQLASVNQLSNQLSSLIYNSSFDGNVASDDNGST